MCMFLDKCAAAVHGRFLDGLMQSDYQRVHVSKPLVKGLVVVVKAQAHGGVSRLMVRGQGEAV